MDRPTSRESSPRHSSGTGSGSGSGHGDKEPRGKRRISKPRREILKNLRESQNSSPYSSSECLNPFADNAVLVNETENNRRSTRNSLKVSQSPAELHRHGENSKSPVRVKSVRFGENRQDGRSQFQSNGNQSSQGSYEMTVREQPNDDAKKIDIVQDQVNGLVDIMKENVNKINKRGAQIEDLTKTAEKLEIASQQFAKTSTVLKNKEKAKYNKSRIICWGIMISLLAVLIGVIVYFATAAE